MDHQDSTSVPFNAVLHQLIADASDEAARRRHEYMGTEHLVLALSRPAAGPAILHALTIDPQRLYARLDGIVQSGSITTSETTERPFTSRTKQAFAFAAESARQLGHSHIGVPHLLVGLLREQKNLGAQVLTEAGLVPERAEEYARQSGE